MEEPSAPVLLREDVGRVRRLTLNRPDRLNALSHELVETLGDSLLQAGRDDAVRVVILAGAGRAFCAGYDLKEEAEEQREGGKDIVSWRGELAHDVVRMLEIFDNPKPVVAQVHGYCLAGGCDLMMMCDLAVCSDDAMFGEPEIRFGSGVVTMVMPWLLGARKAKELLFTGEDRIPAMEALRIGLVNRVVPGAELESATLELANGIAKLDPVAVSLTKKAINRAWDVAGFREALWANVDIDSVIEGAEVPERLEFNRIREGQGLKAAIAWRDAKFRSESPA